MTTITKGQVFSQLEQITNTKLHNLVDLATIDGIFPSITATGICLSQTAISASGTGTTPFLCTRFFNLNINGTTLYIPCATATA